MIRCHITDRRTLASETRLLDSIARSLSEGIEWIQIREKDLDARPLFELVARAVALPNPHGSKILVNTRLDVALAAGAQGAHFPAGSPPCREWCGLVPSGFLLGVSCHTADEVREAERDGADYAVFGPVFAPLSKSSDLAPRGVAMLAEVASQVRIPVLALGGITAENAGLCIASGAAGVAGITLFAT